MREKLEKKEIHRVGKRKDGDGMNKNKRDYIFRSRGCCLTGNQAHRVTFPSAVKASGLP